ncbi:MAG: WbqC family protein [Paludibacter sp.]|nr:WbqC family protein [Paludibacter sp.]
MLQNNKAESALFSTAYLAPVEYFQYLKTAGKVCIEQHEYYQKQTYRSRCRIATANGIMDLSIPVEKRNHTLIRDIRISEHSDWQTQHWRSIEAAYNSSPFFEYYADDFRPFFEKKWLFLWDFNMELLHKTLELLDIETEILLIETYEPQTGEETLDLREIIHPKKEASIPLKSYYQVFATKFGFIPNMSIIDLLFNMGNESQLVIAHK